MQAGGVESFSDNFRRFNAEEDFPADGEDNDDSYYGACPAKYLPGHADSLRIGGRNVNKQ